MTAEELRPLISAEAITLVIAGISIITSFGIPMVVYNVLSKVIDQLRIDVDNGENARLVLQKDIDRLKASENKWFRRSHALGNLILKNSCKGSECKVLIAYNDFLEKDGEVS